jgi:serine protease
MNKYAALSVVAFSPFMLQAEEFRVVVSYPIEQATMRTKHSLNQEKGGARCLPSLDTQRMLCVPVKNTSMKAKKASRYNPNRKRARSQETFLMDADNAEQLIETLSATGWYSHVEVDVKIVVPNLFPQYSGEPLSVNPSFTKIVTSNDPDLADQTYFQSAKEQVTGSGFLNAKERLSNPESLIGVAVMDSSFWENEEVSFIGGFNFSTINNRKRDDNFIGERESDRTLCGGHGFGVAGAISAQSNNELGGAGAVDNIAMYAINVMTCGVGFLSDVSDALRWVAGENIEGVENYDGPAITVVNMSLGGTSPTCPVYMQDAIDYANVQGITVVVAGGNNGQDASMHSPGNCDGVITVGALTTQATLSNFSNHGEKIDISAQGESIVSVGHTDDTTYYWEGTSFSAPLVTAAIAMAKKESPELTPLAMKQLLMATSTSFARQNDDSDCALDATLCGAGLLNVESLITVTQVINGQSMASQIKHPLNSVAEQNACDQAWFFEHFGEKRSLCDSYDLSFVNVIGSNDPTYRLLSAPLTADLATDGTFVRDIITATVRISGSEFQPENLQYGYQLCENGQCGDTIYRFNLDSVSRPTACQNP